MPTEADVKKAFEARLAAVGWTGLQDAKLGAVVTINSVSVRRTGVPGQFNQVYIRVGGGRSWTTADRGSANVADEYGRDVVAGFPPRSSRLTLFGAGTVAGLNAGSIGTSGGVQTSGVATHARQHEFGVHWRQAPAEGAVIDPVLPWDRQIRDLLIVPPKNSSGLVFDVLPGWASVNGTRLYFRGGTVDVTGHLGSSSGQAKIGRVELDSTGALQASYGSNYSEPVTDNTAIGNAPAATTGRNTLGFLWLPNGLTTGTWQHIQPTPVAERTGALQAFTDTDEKVKVSSNDTTAGYLSAKVTGSDGITLTEVNDGGSETLNVSLSDTTARNRFLVAYNYHLSGILPYRIGIGWGDTDRRFTRTLEPAVDLGAGGQWDDTYVKDQCLVEGPDGILYLFYSAYSGSVWAIGVSISRDQGETWTKSGSNPILSGGGVDAPSVTFPAVLYDRAETDASKRWKMWYSGGVPAEIYYAYAADPESTWTKFGKVLSVGSGGSWDDAGHVMGSVVRVGDTYTLFYTGSASVTPGIEAFQGGAATFTDPEGTYTKHANNPILLLDGLKTTLSSNIALNDTTIAVADSSEFPIGCPVLIQNASVQYISHIIARPTTTSLVLEDPAPVAVSSSGAVVRSPAYDSITIRSSRWDGGWSLYCTPFGRDTNGILETCMVAWWDGVNSAHLDYGAGLIVRPTLAEGQDINMSLENPWVLDTWDTSKRFERESGGGYYQTIRDNGSAETQRGAVNFLNGTGVSTGVADDAGNDETEVTPTLAFSGLSEDTDPDATADFVATYDASAATHKKVRLDALPAAVRLLFSQTADKTVANTTSATSLLGVGRGTKTVPANGLAVGSRLHLAVAGYFSDTGTPTLTWVVSLGGTAVLTSAAITLPSSVSNKGFTLTVEIVCRTTGATGTVVATGQLTLSDGTVANLVKTTTTTVDTTTALALDVTAAWSAASASNTITAQSASIAQLNPPPTALSGDALLLESGDYLLLESGDHILLEG